MNKSILLIDDDEDLREVMSMALAAVGYDVTDFADGKIALAGMRESDSSPGLIVVDYNMPQMDGPSFIHKVRTELDCDAPIIMCSASDSFHDLPDDVMILQKPMDLEELINLASAELPL